MKNTAILFAVICMLFSSCKKEQEDQLKIEKVPQSTVSKNVSLQYVRFTSNTCVVVNTSSYLCKFTRNSETIEFYALVNRSTKDEMNSDMLSRIEESARLMMNNADWDHNSKPSVFFGNSIPSITF